MLPIANERGNTPDDPNKRDPLDFVLWQAAAARRADLGLARGARAGPAGTSSAARWPPATSARPIDIHGGGADLIFPHHECEIAQTENATGEEPFARFWMHVGMVEYQGEKMSKSLGNLVLVRDVLAGLLARTRSGSTSSRTTTGRPGSTATTRSTTGRALADDLREAADFPAYGIERGGRRRASSASGFFNALDDDLNTPIAIEALREIGQRHPRSARGGRCPRRPAHAARAGRHPRSDLDRVRTRANTPTGTGPGGTSWTATDSTT